MRGPGAQQPPAASLPYVHAPRGAACRHQRAVPCRRDAPQRLRRKAPLQQRVLHSSRDFESACVSKARISNDAAMHAAASQHSTTAAATPAQQQGLSASGGVFVVGFRDVSDAPAVVLVVLCDKTGARLIPQSILEQVAGHTS